MICISFSLSKYTFSFKVNCFLWEALFLITAQCYSQASVIQKNHSFLLKGRNNYSLSPSLESQRSNQSLLLYYVFLKHLLYATAVGLQMDTVINAVTKVSSFSSQPCQHQHLQTKSLFKALVHHRIMLILVFYN